LSHIQRRKATKGVEDEEEDLILQTKGVPDKTPAISPALENQIHSLRGGGQPLSPSVRAFFEPRFGYDFSQVRVHTNPNALNTARTLNAQAYTVGRDVVFGNGEYAPETTKGRKLLAHELAHVLQQHGLNDESAGPSIGKAENAQKQAAKSVNRLMYQRFETRWMVPIEQRASDTTIMRSQLFSSTMEICYRLLRSRIFHVSQGGIRVIANAAYDRRGTPECSTADYHMTLSQKGLIFDSEYGTCEFPQGQPFSRQWTNLPNGDYYLTIWTNNTNPTCCLVGNILVEQQSGLQGDSCTQPPPGPLDILHTALDLAGLIPALGAVPDAINAGIYVIEGDWMNAGLSAVAIIPIFGEAATVGKIGTRTVVRVTGEGIERVGSSRIASGLRAARTAVQNIPQGFTERQFERFSRGARRLRKQANLPDGELVTHGSRVSGTARTGSDIDVALRVDDATFFDLAERVLARARPGTHLRETMLDRIRRNGQLSSFDLGPEFQSLRRELLDSESPVSVQFSVLRKGGRLDTGPFIPLE